MIIPVFIPHGGCPQRCRFCNQRISGGAPIALSRLIETIESYLSHGNAEALAFYGGTFTSLSKERQNAYLATVKPYLDSRQIGCIRLSTRPDADAIDATWLCHLRDGYRLRTIELGVQSFSDEVLIALGRSHSVSDAEKAIVLVRDLGLEVGVHLMVGCPGEAFDDDARAIAALRRLRPDFVRIHPMLILSGTELAHDFEVGRFEPLGLEPAVERCAWLVENLSGSGIRVARLGLQANELLEARGSVLAGAYHPAFGDLVYGRIARNRVDEALRAEFTALGDALDGIGTEVAADISASGWVISGLKGHGGRGLAWLKSRFKLCSIALHVLKEGPLYDEKPVQVRLHHSSRPAQCRQVELA